MHVVMVGAGYVGLVSGACFAEFGANVICIDSDKHKINELSQGKIPIYEPGLENLVNKNMSAKRLSFSYNISEVSNADVVFIAVGTPSRRGDGNADLTNVFEAARNVAKNLNSKKNITLVVTKSTVPIGTSSEVEKIIIKERPDLKSGLHFDVASNPEFLREGSAIEDFMHPDRVICGVKNDKAKEILERLYRPINLREIPIIFTDFQTSEISKYAANAFLAAKITFINEVADLCEKTNANVQDVAKSIGLDGRIGLKFLHPGPGFGGSCFPKDTRAYVSMSHKYECIPRLISSVIESNDNRKIMMVNKIIKAMENNVKDKKIAVLGITFKPNTDDLREAPSLVIIPELIKKGSIVKVYDPAGMDVGKETSQFKDVIWCETAKECYEGADALVILTEWNEFRGIDPLELKNALKEPLVIDLRNVFRLDIMKKNSFKYFSVGRPEL